MRPESFVRQRREALFEEQRPRLEGLAYPLLGTVTDAEVVLDQARRQWCAEPAPEDQDPCAALTQLVVRLAVQRLREVTPERQALGPRWLPEPVGGTGDSRYEGSVGVDGPLSLECLVALECLSPPERAAYVLRVTAALPYPQVAAALGRREPAVRQLVHRARSRLPPLVGTDAAQHEVVVRRLDAACRSGSLPTVAEVLAGDVVLHTDDPRSTAAGPHRPADRDQAARSILSALRRRPPGADIGLDVLNGTTGIVVRAQGRRVCALAVRVGAGRVTAVQLMTTPSRLRALGGGAEPTAIV